MNHIPYPTIAIALVVVAGAYEYYVWTVLPRRYSTGYTGSDDELIAKLERLIKLPALLGSFSRLPARLLLAHKYLFTRRYAEGAAQYKLAVSVPMPHGLLADTQRKLAECLEGCGKHDEAVALTEKAQSSINAGPSTPTSMIAQAKLLYNKQDFAGAVAIYETVSEQIAGATGEENVQVLIHASTSAIQAARPDKAAAFAEQAIAAGASGKYLVLAYSMAATGRENLGDIDKALDYTEKALDCVRPTGDSTELSRLLAKLAGIRRNLGDMRGSLEAAVQAIQVNPKERQAYVQAYFTHLLAGDFAAAQHDIDQLRGCEPSILPGQRARETAIVDMLAASYYAEIGEPDRALAAHTAAMEQFKNDAMMSIHGRSLKVWIAAQLGRFDDMDALISQVEGAFPSISHSRGSLMDNFAYLMAAGLAAKRYDFVLKYHDKYMELKPYSGWRARAMLRAGDAHAALGDTIRARQCWQESADANLDTLACRTAAERLGGIG
ncbi:MAG TPA: hypothetical protein VGK19_03520 [Capsulimonadaceae bacterium]|jgi:tetratricopeptide (TPR) repeat protein